MPRIFFAQSRTSSIDFATLTPPPLPRPPAWIWAFTTQTLPPSFLAASTASSTVKAGMPREVGTPKRRNSSLPWYSWMFMGDAAEGIGADSISAEESSLPGHRTRASAGWLHWDRCKTEAARHADLDAVRDAGDG